ncbi:TetR family transcriptional regulator [Saccharothrix sp. ALI-22-I]|uniref:TetR/AcrR family transcriptional regulator n=1 Tax=Saccharothrix sp. ALI-22-I TaxID=1933778 RepID=UPI00097C7650|nr:TetR/AcrR family transcriptional regulator [Saccharothrix sp. ALI-22-I]ONI83544.1 TetR family transcriptional regulator [Saccharothrix sp. ALI-22-I]
MTDEYGLPDDIALLWGLREMPRRGRKPSLTITDITRAAIEIADAEGLGAVSMARVAQQLGNSTMALYRHVKSKDELLALMSEAALEMPPEIPADTDWRTGLTLWTNSVRKTLSRHPWYAHIPLNGPPAGPRNLAWLDSALGTLADTPLDEGDKIRIVMGLITFVHGDLRFSVQVMEGFQENPEAFGRSYSQALKVVVDPRKMPALGRLVAAGVFDYDNLYDEQFVEDDFAFSLNFYLDGVAAHMARKG